MRWWRGENGGRRRVRSRQAESSPTFNSTFWSKGRLLADEGKLQTRWSFGAATGYLGERSESTAGPSPVLTNTGGLFFVLPRKTYSWIVSTERDRHGARLSETAVALKRAALLTMCGNMFYGNMTAGMNLSEVGGITIRNSTQGGGDLREKEPTQTQSVRQLSRRENIVVAMETESWFTSRWWGKLSE